MFYQFNHHCPNWNPQKMWQLAFRLAEGFGYPVSHEYVAGDVPFVLVDVFGVDRFGGSVTIRRMRNWDIITRADEIYDEVMNQPETEVN